MNRADGAVTTVQMLRYRYHGPYNEIVSQVALLLGEHRWSVRLSLLAARGDRSALVWSTHKRVFCCFLKVLLSDVEP